MDANNVIARLERDKENCTSFAEIERLSPIFAEPKYSTDNAMGIAVLCSLQESEHGTNDI